MEQSKFYRIKNITEDKYTLVGCDGSETTRPIQEVDKTASVFTIQDAKDGDVLYHKSPLTGIEYIVMSRGVNGYGAVDSYFRYNSKDGFGICVPSVLSTKLDDITPATKEQRDLLFQKMKEAGYEWDAEKKELKKIEQELSNEYNKREPSAYEAKKWNEAYEKGYEIGYINGKNEQKPIWSEEDEEMVNNIIDTINDSIQYCDVDDIGTKARFALEKEITWLKSLKPNHWKPSEKQMEALWNIIPHIVNSEEDIDALTELSSLYEELKRL